MREYFLLDCETVLNMVYEAENGDPLPFFTQARIWFHLLICPACAGELQKLRSAGEIMKTDFLPPSPEFDEILMKRLSDEAEPEEGIALPAGFSFRGWVFIGFFVLFSLSSSFFGVNFTQIANAEGLSFLLPLGLTIGLVVTCYGALFIGSHLKELSARFRLH